VAHFHSVNPSIWRK